MRLLFDLLHPAHVHLFRHLISRVLAQGGDVLAATREKDVTCDLCEAFHIPQVVLSRTSGGNLLSGAAEWLARTRKLFFLARKFRPDCLLGTSMSIGIVGRAIRRPSFVFNEDDADAVPLFARIAYPTGHYIVTPSCLRHERHGGKHLTYPGYHELAYLHPDHFAPDPGVPAGMGLDVGKPYFLLRLVALKAHHDTHEEGIHAERVRDVVRLLAKHGRVLITSEGDLQEAFRAYAFPLQPEKLHDVLAFASMYIGDSQTMAAEAAVLGVPNLRCNTFVGRLRYLDELERTYGLTKGFLPSDFPKLIAQVETWLGMLSQVKARMHAARERMLAECVNLAAWQYRMLRERLTGDDFA